VTIPADEFQIGPRQEEIATTSRNQIYGGYSPTLTAVYDKSFGCRADSRQAARLICNIVIDIWGQRWIIHLHAGCRFEVEINSESISNQTRVFELMYVCIRKKLTGERS